MTSLSQDSLGQGWDKLGQESGFKFQVSGFRFERYLVHDSRFTISQPDDPCLAAVTVVFGEGISRVDDQAGVGADSFVIDSRVAGADHDAVRTFDQLVGEVLVIKWVTVADRVRMVEGHRVDVRV